MSMTPGKWGRWWRAHYRPICTGLIRWGVILLLVGLFFAFKLHYPSELIVAPTPSISRSAVVGLAIAAAANPLVLLILGWWSVIIGQSVLTHHMDREERVRGLRFSRWLTPWLWSIGGGCLIGIGVAMGVMAWAGQGTPSSSGPALSLLMLAGIEAVMLSLWVWTLGIMAFWVTRSALGGIGTVGGWIAAAMLVHPRIVWIPGDVWLMWLTDTLRRAHTPLGVMGSLFAPSSLPQRWSWEWGIATTLGLVLLGLWGASHYFGRR